MTRAGTASRRRFKLSSIAIAAGAVALAALAATVTWGGVNKTRLPALALRVSPGNGFAMGNAAVQALAAKAGPTSTAIGRIAVAPDLRELALDGYRREPLAARSLAVLALDAEHGGHAPRARRLMAAALELSRRDSLVNGWQVVDASRAGDLDRTIAALNRAMTTNPASAAVYVPALIKALEQPASVGVMARVLARRPDWELRFWRAAIAEKRVIGNAGRLRVLLERRDEQDAEIDRALLAALAANRQFTAAASLYRRLPGASRIEDAVVRNGAFRALPRWPVFDWDVLATGEYSGTIEPRGNGLIADVVPGTGGLIARQLVILPRRPLRLEARLAHRFEPESNSLWVRLECAVDNSRLLEWQLDAQSFSRSFAPRGPCPYYWLDVSVRSGLAENRAPLALRRIAIVPAA